MLVHKANRIRFLHNRSAGQRVSIQSDTILQSMIHSIAQPKQLNAPSAHQMHQNASTDRAGNF